MSEHMGKVPYEATTVSALYVLPLHDHFERSFPPRLSICAKVRFDSVGARLMDVVHKEALLASATQDYSGVPSEILSLLDHRSFRAFLAVTVSHFDQECAKAFFWLGGIVQQNLRCNSSRGVNGSFAVPIEYY